MVCVFIVRDEVTKVARPLTVAPVPIGDAPSENVTISPSGIAPWLDVTAAVNVTDCPTSEGDPDVVNTVSDGNPLLICCRSGEDVLPELLPSPEYAAVMEWVPVAE